MFSSGVMPPIPSALRVSVVLVGEAVQVSAPHDIDRFFAHKHDCHKAGADLSVETFDHTQDKFVFSSALFSVPFMLSSVIDNVRL